MYGLEGCINQYVIIIAHSAITESHMTVCRTKLDISVRRFTYVYVLTACGSVY